MADRLEDISELQGLDTRNRDFRWLNYGLSEAYFRSTPSTPLPPTTDAVSFQPPRVRQFEARARILDEFKRRARLQVPMACRTGKTPARSGDYRGAGCTQHRHLSPSLALFSQTLQAWVSNAELDLQCVLCVCSDESVATLDDEHEVLEDLPVAVTTSPEDIGLKVATLGRDLIVLCIYASAPTLAQGLPVGFAFDMGILDEAH